VPWARLIGLRNILAHEYSEILIDRIWHIATVSVPELLALLAPLVPPPPTDE
jgi:uncharacterized protein with HEPN domain